MHRPDAHPFEWIAARAREVGVLDPSVDQVGIEGDSHFFSARAYLALAAGLPGVRLVDSAELVNWVRLVKSQHELQQLRIAGSIAAQAMRIALDQLRPGRRQCDLVAEILAAQATGTPEHGGDYPAIVPMLPTGHAAGTPHLTWTDRPFVAGEATTIELAGRIRPVPRPAGPDGDARASRRSGWPTAPRWLPRACRPPWTRSARAPPPATCTPRSTR